MIGEQLGRYNEDTDVEAQTVEAFEHEQHCDTDTQASFVGAFGSERGDHRCLDDKCYHTASQASEQEWSSSDPVDQQSAEYGTQHRCCNVTTLENQLIKGVET